MNRTYYYGVCFNAYSKTTSTLLIKVLQLHSRQGFIVQIILMDMEFDKVIPKLPDLVVNMSAAREYVA